MIDHSGRRAAQGPPSVGLCWSEAISLEAGRVRSLSIPWPDDKVRTRIGKLVMEAQRLRDDAVSADRDARTIVEAAIEKGATN
ncbi:MAG: hypothetical protein IPM54_19090 [Polyangiaceae bacterium]|nr:hypothetical protein [Polyangiaceae bacterium]